VTSLSHNQLHAWIDCVGDINHVAGVDSSSVALVFHTSISEKCKSTSSSAIPVKNWQGTIGTEGS
jgi:hypothetical protein